MVVILVLSAAFDTVDHDILLTILNKQFGICGKALEWLNSYLRPRFYKVRIGKDYSHHQQLHFSVPQGSCSGANLFTCYCSLIDQVVPKDIIFSGFSDDNVGTFNNRSKEFRSSLHHTTINKQKSFLAGSRTQEQQTKQIMELTFSNIKEWMDSMRLKLNSDKTEIFYIIKESTPSC